MIKKSKNQVELILGHGTCCETHTVLHDKTSGDKKFILSWHEIDKLVAPGTPLEFFPEDAHNWRNDPVIIVFEDLDSIDRLIKNLLIAREKIYPTALADEKPEKIEQKCCHHCKNSYDINQLHYDYHPVALSYIEKNPNAKDSYYKIYLCEECYKKVDGSKDRPKERECYNCHHFYPEDQLNYQLHPFVAEGIAWNEPKHKIYLCETCLSNINEEI